MLAGDNRTVQHGAGLVWQVPGKTIKEGRGTGDGGGCGVHQAVREGLWEEVTFHETLAGNETVLSRRLSRLFGD